MGTPLVDLGNFCRQQARHIKRRVALYIVLNDVRKTLVESDVTKPPTSDLDLWYSRFDEINEKL